MVRIAGVDIPNEKRIDISLTYLYGVGRSNAREALKAVAVDGSKRVKDLSEEEVSKIARHLEAKYRIEGDLREEVAENIKRLKAIGTYRGSRHSRNLPARGQRTRSNARTKRGKRVTIGALRKETRVKLGTSGKSVAPSSAEAKK